LRHLFEGAIAVSLVCGLAVCAKKMLPPSPDRFPPHIEEIRTRNRVRLELVFDEDIDPGSVIADSFEVLGPGNKNLELRGAMRGRRPNRVELWTWPQEPVLYRVSGTVTDLAGNIGRFRSRFKGSERKDTIPPRVVRISPAPGSENQIRASVGIGFSEPVDTLTLPGYLFVPGAYDTVFHFAWEPNWQGFNLTLEDSASSGIIYFLLLPGVPDLEGNPLRGQAFTYFTQDSLLEGNAVRGRAIWHHCPLGTGTVLFSEVGEDSEPMPTTGLAPILEGGSFATKLMPGRYRAIAVADTNGDRLMDLTGGPVRFNTDAESLDIFLLPETLPRPIDAYRR